MSLRSAILFLFIVGLSAPYSGCIRRQMQIDMSDAAIRARVKSTIKQHPEIETGLMSVSVHNRTAYLSGMVATYAMKRKLTPIVRRVQGVQGVVNNLVPQE